MKNVWTTKNLKLSPQNLQYDKFIRKFPILNEIVIDDYFDVVSISADGKLFVNRGVLIYYNEEFYFVDLSSAI